MTLSVSSLTCPDWDLFRMIDEVAEHGIRYIDLRTLEGRRDVWNLPYLRAEARAETRRRLADHGVSVAGVSTSVRAGSDEDWQPELQAAVELCDSLGGAYLRIFAGARTGGAEPLSDQSIERIAADYRSMCSTAEDFGVQVLLETHDVVSAGSLTRRIVETVDHRLAGVVWDVRHPRHLAGESYTETAQALRGVLRLVHVKDFAGPDCRLVPFGTGEVDVPGLVAVLRSIDYAGHIVLEQPRVHSTNRPMPEANIAGFARVWSEIG